MGEYTDAIERINIELSIANKLQLLDALEQYLRCAILRWVASEDADSPVAGTRGTAGRPGDPCT